MGLFGFCVFLVQRKYVWIVQIPIHGFDDGDKGSEVFTPVSRVPHGTIEKESTIVRGYRVCPASFCLCEFRCRS